jgi:Tfp pilus assembly protein PilP
MRAASISFVLCLCTAAASAQAPTSGTAEKAARAAGPALAQTPASAQAPLPAQTQVPAANQAKALAQTAVAAGAGAQPATASQPAESYTYEPSGRRDPFLSLIGGGVDRVAANGGKKTEGSPGLAVSEIAVRGIMQSRGTLIAMVQGPDNKTYLVHAGDKLVDGTVKIVTPTGLVIVQDVNDPLSLVKQREIRKMLRSFEDGKQ